MEGYRMKQMFKCSSCEQMTEDMCKPGHFHSTVTGTALPILLTIT